MKLEIKNGNIVELISCEITELTHFRVSYLIRENPITIHFPNINSAYTINNAFFRTPKKYPQINFRMI